MAEEETLSTQNSEKTKSDEKKDGGGKGCPDGG